jgi:hypothetical protein
MSGTAESRACVYGCCGARTARRGRLLDHPAQVHDRDPVAEVPHHAEVVRDEDERDADSLRRFSSRFITCAWIDTSSAETGSSAR